MILSIIDSINEFIEPAKAWLEETIVIHLCGLRLF